MSKIKKILNVRKLTVFVLSAFLLSGFFVPPTANAVVTAIDLTSPSSGTEVWSGTHDIVWTATGDPGDTVSILISDNDFVSSATVVAAIAYDASSFPWDTTTVLDGTAYKIKVLSPLGVFDASAFAFEIDNTSPVIDTVTTYDTDFDGDVDKATIVFSEDVDDSSFLPSDFTIDGIAGTLITTGTADDDTFDVSFATVIGTGVKDLTYTAGSGKDLADPGNLMLSETKTAVDAAAPV